MDLSDFYRKSVLCFLSLGISLIIVGFFIAGLFRGDIEAMTSMVTTGLALTMINIAAAIIIRLYDDWNMNRQNDAEEIA